MNNTSGEKTTNDKAVDSKIKNSKTTSYKKLSEHEVKILTQWWNHLNGNNGIKGRYGERAQLRRATGVNDIIISPAFFNFLHQMPEKWKNQERISFADAAFIAAMCARVKEPSPHSFAKSLALPKQDGGKSAMSQLRFMQLQKSRSEQDFFTRLSRAIKLLNGNVNIESLSNNILQWLAEYRFGEARKAQDRLAIKWASDYYTHCKD